MELLSNGSISLKPKLQIKFKPKFTKLCDPAFKFYSMSTMKPSFVEWPETDHNRIE